MKKILITMLLAALVLSPTALAATKDEALSTAQSLAGETASLRDSDLDDGVYEFEFQNDTDETRIDIDVDAETGAALKTETEYRRVKKAQQATLDETQAKEAGQTILGETAVINYALLEKDDGQYEWKLFYSDNGNLGLLTLQAETGEIQALETYLNYDGLTADQAVQALADAKGSNVEILELDMDFNDGAQDLYYDGKASLDGTIYEFELKAQDGQIVEWERD